MGWQSSCLKLGLFSLQICVIWEKGANSIFAVGSLILLSFILEKELPYFCFMELLNQETKGFSEWWKAKVWYWCFAGEIGHCLLALSVFETVESWTRRLRELFLFTACLLQGYQHNSNIWWPELNRVQAFLSPGSFVSLDFLKRD